MNYELSLCIPTNGVIEWVIPVLDSIYKQHISMNTYQVIVSDNGNNDKFEKAMISYTRKYNNFVYHHTDVHGFLNQIECFKLAEGKLIKFINHRMPLLSGSLDYFVKYAETHDANTVVYFSNGFLKNIKQSKELSSFDDFVRTLSYWSSWSGGLAFWQEDIEKIKKIKTFNSLFPHTDVLFMKRDTANYSIINKKLLGEVKTDETKKGHYNLFKAFAYEFPGIINGLYNDSDISKETYVSVLYDLQLFIVDLYAQYVIMGKPCSYDLTDSSKYISENFDLNKVVSSAKRKAIVSRAKELIKKVLKR